jgi:hypothetical protein
MPVDMVAPLIARRLMLPEIIATLPSYPERVIIETYDHIRMLQFDMDRCCDVA